MRCFQDPTEVEWIEDKLWSQRLDEGWDLAQVRWAGDVASWCDRCAGSVYICVPVLGADPTQFCVLMQCLDAMHTNRVEVQIGNEASLSLLLHSWQHCLHVVLLLLLTNGCSAWFRLNHSPCHVCCDAGAVCCW
jgi:hypothetical protein